MRLEPALELARRGELYPGIILHGGDDLRRRQAASEIARTLLCERSPGERPCGRCRHCRRVDLEAADLFHPDFLVLERDLRTSTSAEATRTLMRSVQQRPFEARGQVFVVTSAETLSGGAANALLKSLEEPPTSAPRHFLLLCPSSIDLLPTLRSRCLSIFLGAEAEDRVPEPERIDSLATTLGEWQRSRSPVLLLALARALAEGERFDEPRAAGPWCRVAATLVELGRPERIPDDELRRSLLGLAEELLTATDLRARGIPAPRILEGLVSKHLGGRG